MSTRSTHVFYEDYAPGKFVVAALMPTNESMVPRKSHKVYLEPKSSHNYAVAGLSTVGSPLFEEAVAYVGVYDTKFGPIGPKLAIFFSSWRICISRMAYSLHDCYF